MKLWETRDDAASNVLSTVERIAETSAPQELSDLVEPLRNQHVLERFALLADLEVAIAVAPLEIVVVLDGQPIERRALAQGLDHRVVPLGGIE